MKRLLLLFLLFGGIFSAAGQVQIDQTTAQLAMKYYNSRDFEKAAPLIRDLYEVTKNRSYFRMYLDCLAMTGRYGDAENEIKKEIRKTKTDQADLQIFWGYLLKMQKQPAAASEKFTEALKMLPPNKSAYQVAANTFLQVQEFEMAERVYLQGRQVLPGEKFHNELSRVYSYLRNYDQMMEELLSLVQQDERNLPMVQSTLSSALYLDVENGLRDEFKNVVLKRIQAEPAVMGYTRLLIWFFLQERQFSAALRQAVALDRRTGQEDPQIIALAQMALNNRSYSDAANAFEYILGKGAANPYYNQAFTYKLHARYQQFTDEETADQAKGAELAQQFDEGLSRLGYTQPNLFLIREYAHLLAFYLGKNPEAIAVLEKGLQIPALKPSESGQLKTELADIYLNAGDPWEATLLYSQVIDANRNNALGDEVKLKKARLGYYLGNFSWAQAQLDVLKASTSKLTANDAMELSLFIRENSEESDTANLALQYFARADFLFFCKQDAQALATLDSIENLFPYHTLVDDLLFRKAKILLHQNKDEEAVKLLEQIVKDFSWELLADDALFLLAETCNYQLGDKTRAAEAYKRILFDYPGSIYVSEARKKYRELTGEASETEKPAAKFPPEEPLPHE